VNIMAITIKKTTPEEKKTHQELLSITLRFGFAEPDLRLRKDRMERSMRRPVDEIEAALSLLNEIASSADAVQDKVSLYLGMAEILHIRGEDPSQPLMVMHKTELATFKEIGFRLVRVEASKDACAQCRKISGLVVPIEEAMRGGVLPHRSCKHDVRKGSGLCRCRFLAEFG
jgi:hypothetical protein